MMKERSSPKLNVRQVGNVPVTLRNGTEAVPYNACPCRLGLFESEPALQDQKVPWAYNHLTFSRTIGDHIICCEIEPGYETMKFRLVQRGAEIINLDLRWVSGLTVETRPGFEALVAHFRDRHGLPPLRIQFRPTVHLAWGTTIDLI